MTIMLRPSGERSHVSWMSSDRWVTFSAEQRNDPLWFDFRVLDSLVEYDLAPGTGILVRSSRDGDLITYVEDGSLNHEDSAGRIDVQKMGDFRGDHAPLDSTRRAINPSSTEHAHVIQSGLLSPPDAVHPAGEQKPSSRAERTGVLRLVASQDGRMGSLRLCPDVRIYSSLLRKGTHLIHEFLDGRHGWLHVVAGQIQFREHVLDVGDGAGLTEERSASFTARIPSEVLLFDLP